MNNVSHNNSWNLGVTQPHMEPPHIPLIKIKHGDKSDKYFVKLKLRRGPTSYLLDLYEFKMDFFDNGDPYEFFFLWKTSI